jgi:hypothetical protein
MRSIYLITAYVVLVAAFFFVLATHMQSLPKIQSSKGSPDIAKVDIKREALVRLPQVAGAFYPNDSAILKQRITYFLSKAPQGELEGLSVVVVPHAGYKFSGQVAAYSYKQLIGKKYTRVVVIGPSHYRGFDGISVFNGDYYETPLGKVEVDQELANNLISSSKKISYIPQAEEKEHSVEVQIPFLQTILGDFKIVPILMGFQSLENAEILADAISQYVDENTLIVASSDLSHYHSYNEAVSMDNLTLSYIENMDIGGLYQAIISGKCEMCGYGPVITAMLIAEKLGKTQVKILKYANSGDVTGDASRVVGYASIAFYGETQYSGRERAELLRIARKAIESYVRYGQTPIFEVTDPKLLEKKAAFVTITEGGHLRGCIGTTRAVQPLYLAVRDAAISAAVRDPRFAPLSIDELDKIHLEISVLSEPEEIKSIDEIEVGKHGLIIEKNDHSGLLLPQVATDYGWDRNTFLDETCRKAGLEKGCWKEGARIWIFEAEVFEE